MNIKIPKITIYDKYIFKQVTGATLVAILLFTIVWIAPEILLNTIRDTLDGKYGFKTMILLLFYELPKIVDKAIPVGLLLGSLFTFDNLSKNSEVTIFRAIGISFQRMVVPVVFLSLILSLFCFALKGEGTPFAENKLGAIRGEVSTAQYIYTQKDKLGHPLLAVVVSRAIGRNIENITVLDFSTKIYQDVHQLSHIYAAKRGHANDDKWELEDITTYNISNDGIFIETGHLDKLNILDETSAHNAYVLMTYSAIKERSIATKDLKNYIKLLEIEKLEDEHNYILNKYIQRSMSSIVCVLLAIFGCLLGISKPREQRVVGFTIGIGCIFLYFITIPFFDMLAEKSILSPYLTATLPVIAFMGAIYCFHKLKDL